MTPERTPVEVRGETHRMAAGSEAWAASQESPVSLFPSWACPKPLLTHKQPHRGSYDLQTNRVQLSLSASHARGRGGPSLRLHARRNRGHVLLWEHTPSTTGLPQPAATQLCCTPLQCAPLSSTEHWRTPQEGWVLEIKVFTLGTEKEMKAL